MAAPKGNINAEKWTLEGAKKLFNECLKVAKDKARDDNDFIGEVAQACGVTRYQLDHLEIKFPELSHLHKEIKSCCESNCFTNGKNSKIVPSLAIMNLKSNHGWTDRVDTTSKGNEITHEKVVINFK